MDGSVRGMPLLAQEAPQQGDDGECHKCGKGFVPLIVRSRKCAHCGYNYCHSCSDHQALKRRNGAEAGYDPVHVCSYCIDNLTMTSYGRAQLKLQPIHRLKTYLAAYGISIPPGIAEKNDLVDLVLNSRQSNGCLPVDRENWYRRYGVPGRQQGQGRSRGGSGSAASGGGGGGVGGVLDEMANTFSGFFGDGGGNAPTPPPRQQPQQARQQARPTPPPRPQQRPSPRPAPQQQQQQQRYAPPPYPPPPRQTPRPASQPPPSARPAPPRQPTPAPPPTMDQLVNLPSEELSHLSISALKSVLEHNHVNTHLLVEKEDLVNKVRTLVEQEKRERVRLARLREMEEQQERLREQEMEDIRRAERESRETLERDRARRMQAARTATEGHPGVVIEVESPQSSTEGGEGAVETGAAPRDETHLTAEAVPPEVAASVPLPQSPLQTPRDGPTTPASEPPPVPPKEDLPPPAASAAETTHKKSRADNVEYDLSLIGRCVVCQDEEANIAIVDCGHLALCMACSDLIMKSSRECPLCRTRIVTEQRLLRIYRT